ncbi:MAG: hypothetical protein ACOX5Z_01225 [Desulfobulbus sp.]|jgi:hypothetical protein
MNALFPALALALLLALSAGCAPQPSLHEGPQSQLQKRSYQSRVFMTPDREKVLRAVIATLQDLGFVIDNADALLGTVSATRLDGDRIKITVSVRPRGAEAQLVRATAQINSFPIEDPKQYQNFFISLEKSLFLAAHAGE